uniref:Uncharacterized protein n=2 Tax=Brassica oleracea TaxID=3712 RepID=A0A0D3BFK0_BRAOL
MLVCRGPIISVDGKIESLSSSPLNLCHNQTSSSSPPQLVVFTAIARVVTTIA